MASPSSAPPTTPAHATAQPPPVTDASRLRRVVVGAITGTALEWYDFFIYGLAAALVFDELFFPTAAPGVGTLAAFATFGVGFLVRPFGGVLFGNLGDRIGRRQTLVITTLLMGVSTGVIGLLPSYDTIGYAAPALLVLMRIFQGLGAGAEFGGAATLLAEHAPHGRRGYYGAFAQTGVQIGLVLGTATFLLVGLLDDEALLSWGWRVPFLLSFLLIGVSLWVRLRVEESPVFQEVQRHQKVIKLPIREALTAYPRSMLVGIGAHIVDVAAIYVYVTFSVAYLTDEEGFSRTTALLGIVIAGIVVILLQPVFGALADRIGRRPLNLFSTIFTIAWALPFLALLDTGVPVLAWLALTVGLALGLGPMIAVQGAFYSELFGARVRYSGFAASREIGAALAGFSALISAALLAAGDGRPYLVAVWIVFAGLVSLVAFLASAETKDVDINAMDLDQKRIVTAPTRAAGDAGDAGDAVDGARPAGRP